MVTGSDTDTDVRRDLLECLQCAAATRQAQNVGGARINAVTRALGGA
jgi:hypothetical protein